MKNGEVGIFPECKLERLYLNMSTNGQPIDQFNHDKDNLIPVMMFTKNIKRVGTVKIVGVIFSCDMPDSVHMG